MNDKSFAEQCNEVADYLDQCVDMGRMFDNEEHGWTVAANGVMSDGPGDHIAAATRAARLLREAASMLAGGPK